MIAVSILLVLIVGGVVYYQVWKRYWDPRLDRPRITHAEIDTFEASLEAATLPMAKIEVVEGAEMTAASSRIGGAPYCDETAPNWPEDSKGNSALRFVAQINFAEMEPMDGFPSAGLLQLFYLIEQNGDFGAEDDPSAWRVRWFDTPTGDETLPVPEFFKEIKNDAAFSERATNVGLPTRFTSSQAPGNPYGWPHDEASPVWSNRLAETPEVDERLRDLEGKFGQIREDYGTHWVGGQPSFAQFDVREEPELRDLDRVLFHLGADDDICLGDAGELNLMISQENLRNRRFDLAYCTWDCY